MPENAFIDDTFKQNDRQEAFYVFDIYLKLDTQIGPKQLEL